MYDKNKIKNFMKYIFCVPILCTIIFYASSMTAKAHDVNDTTIAEHSITWYIDYESGTSYGLYKGTFVESLNIPNGAVIYKGSYGYFYYAIINDNGGINTGVIEKNATSQYGNSWLSSFDSPTYSPNKTGHSWSNYDNLVRSFGEIVSCTLPVFKNKTSASEYLLNGVMNSDTCLNYDEFFKIVSPEFDSLYNDSKYKHKFYINLHQLIDRLDNCSLDYSVRIDINTQDVTSSEIFTTQQIGINNPQKIILDLSSVMDNLVYTDDEHFCNIEIKFKNINSNNQCSDECTVIISVNSQGMAYTTTGFPNVTYPQNYTPIYNADGVVNDMYQGILGSNHINNYGDNDSSFIGSVVNGFGLLGNNGLFALMSQLFTFIPGPIWTMVYAFFGGAIAIALFKLVTR